MEQVAIATTTRATKENEEKELDQKYAGSQSADSIFSLSHSFVCAFNIPLFKKFRVFFSSLFFHFFGIDAIHGLIVYAYNM